MANITYSKYFTNYVVILLGFSLAGFTLVYNLIKEGELLWSPAYNVGLGIAQIAGIYLFIQSGTFKRTKFYRYSRIGISIIIIGILLKLLHYYGSEIVVTLGYSLILIFYTMSFLRKPYKQTLDYLKLAFAFTFSLSILGRFFHHSLGEFPEVPMFLMIIMVILHINGEKKLGFPEDKKDDFSL